MPNDKMLLGIVLLFALTVLILPAGCGDPTTAPAPSSTNRVSSGTGTGSNRHKHDWKRPGARGGLIEQVDRARNYHVEIIFDDDGTLTLYVLGRDWRKLCEVEEQTLKATFKDVITGKSTTLSLSPVRQEGDQPGMTSRFVGRLPRDFQHRQLEGAVSSLRIDGNRYVVPLRNEVHEVMPTKVADEKERKLYLTPGGKYTAADIKANGNVTASQKYPQFHATHDFKPKRGDRICPITFTKATSKCTWIVDGQVHWFCCPPCIDEFVAQAKKQPETIKPPESYVKK